MTRGTALGLVLAAAALAATPTTAETWKLISSSAATGYLADMDSLTPDGDAILVTVARTPRRDREATDLSHGVDRFAIRCAARRLRLVETIDFGPDGQEAGRYPETEDFVAVQRDSFDDLVRAIACDLAVPAGPSWPTVRAYIEAGRPE